MLRINWGYFAGYRKIVCIFVYICTNIGFIMLLTFTIKNFSTFREKAVLSLLASDKIKDIRESENISPESKFNIRILKSAIVYGANASGKSKLFEALMFMRHFVRTSSKETQIGDEIDVIPFKLNSETEKAPTEFEVIFISKGVIYRYGFEAQRNKIISEWLYYRPKTKEIELFYRDGQTIDTHDRNFSKGNMVIREGLVRDNALLVSVAAQFNDPISIEIIEWFQSLKTISGLHEYGYQGFTMSQTENPARKAKILELLKAADLGIQDIQLQKLDSDKLPKDMPKELKDKISKELNEEQAEFVSDVLTVHKKYDANQQNIGTVRFSLSEDESSGTAKFFALTGPIIDVLEHGHTLMVDELDSKLHPNLVCKLVALFNSAELNKKNAQLIFNTHNTNLLSSGLFRRDQIWFTEKNKFGEARLYALSDFKSSEVRKNDSYEENYIRGKYGAVPYLSTFDNLNTLILPHENEEQNR